MSNAMNRARLPFVILSSVLIASCAAPANRSGAQGQWREQVTSPGVVAASDEKPPMILPETYYSAARLLESRGKYLRARQQYRKAVTVDHSYVDAFHRLGLVQSLLGERKLAVNALARAVELRPDDSILRNNLGFEYVLCERWDEAQEELSTAIRLDPGFARAHINLGIVQSHMGQFELALTSFHTALPLPDAHYNLGLMYRGQERYEEATEEFERVLEIDPEFAVAWKQLRQVRARIARIAEAKAKIAAANTEQPDVVQVATDARRDAEQPAPSAQFAEVLAPAVAADLLREQIEALFVPDELAGEADLMTADIGFLMALVDRDPDCLEEFGWLHAATPVAVLDDNRYDHEIYEGPEQNNSVALQSPNDEFEMGEMPTPYGEDMPNYFETIAPAGFFVEFSTLPEEDFWVAPAESPAPPLLLCESEFVAPPPVIASESDRIADTHDPDGNCEELLLVEMIGNFGPWFAVPPPILPDTEAEDFFSGWPNHEAPIESNADAEMVFSVISSFGSFDAEPAFTPADPTSKLALPVSDEFEAVASIDAWAVLRQLEDELAQTRAEIRCLESMDELPAHENFAMANGHRAKSSHDASGYSSAHATIPEPLHWMLDMRNPTLASAPATSPMVSSPPAEMGPPAPRPSQVASDSRPVRARLTASSTGRPPREKPGQQAGSASARPFQVTDYEIRDLPVVAPSEPSGHHEDPQRAVDTQESGDNEDMDEWVSIVRNELDCLEDASRNTPARRKDLFNSRSSIGWPSLDVYDQLMLPGDPRPNDQPAGSARSRQFGAFPRPAAPSIPGLRPSDRPRGAYGHVVVPD